MSRIAPHAAGLVAMPLSMALVASDATAATIGQDAMPAPPQDASAAAETTATPTPDATVPAATSSSVVPGATAAPAVIGGSAFAKPATAITTAQVGTPAAFAQPPSTTDGIGGAMSALIVVIALILALAWLAKRMPVLGGGAGSNPALRIVGSLALGPRERVIVIAVGDTQLLLGVGAGGTHTLHTLSEPLPVAASTTPAFAQLLAQHFGKKA